MVVGLIENDGGHYYNTSLFITPEGIALSYRKTHLWVSEPGTVLSETSTRPCNGAAATSAC